MTLPSRNSGPRIRLGRGPPVNRSSGSNPSGSPSSAPPPYAPPLNPEDAFLAAERACRKKAAELAQRYQVFTEMGSDRSQKDPRAFARLKIVGEPRQPAPRRSTAAPRSKKTGKPSAVTGSSRRKAVPRILPEDGAARSKSEARSKSPPQFKKTEEAFAGDGEGSPFICAENKCDFFDIFSKELEDLSPQKTIFATQHFNSPVKFGSAEMEDTRSLPQHPSMPKKEAFSSSTSDEGILGHAPVSVQEVDMVVGSCEAGEPLFGISEVSSDMSLQIAARGVQTSSRKSCNRDTAPVPSSSSRNNNSTLYGLGFSMDRQPVVPRGRVKVKPLSSCNFLRPTVASTMQHCKDASEFPTRRYTDIFAPPHRATNPVWRGGSQTTGFSASRSPLKKKMPVCISVSRSPLKPRIDRLAPAGMSSLDAGRSLESSFLVRAISSSPMRKSLSFGATGAGENSRGDVPKYIGVTPRMSANAKRLSASMHVRKMTPRVPRRRALSEGLPDNGRGGEVPALRISSKGSSQDRFGRDTGSKDSLKPESEDWAERKARDLAQIEVQLGRRRGALRRNSVSFSEPASARGIRRGIRLSDEIEKGYRMTRAFSVSCSPSDRTAIGGSRGRARETERFMTGLKASHASMGPVMSPRSRSPSIGQSFLSTQVQHDTQAKLPSFFSRSAFPFGSTDPDFSNRLSEVGASEALPPGKIVRLRGLRLFTDDNFPTVRTDSSKVSESEETLDESVRTVGKFSSVKSLMPPNQAPTPPDVLDTPWSCPISRRHGMGMPSTSRSSGMDTDYAQLLAEISCLCGLSQSVSQKSAGPNSSTLLRPSFIGDEDVTNLAAFLKAESVDEAAIRRSKAAAEVDEIRKLRVGIEKENEKVRQQEAELRVVKERFAAELRALSPAIDRGLKLCAPTASSRVGASLGGIIEKLESGFIMTKNESPTKKSFSTERKLVKETSSECPVDAATLEAVLQRLENQNNFASSPKVLSGERDFNEMGVNTSVVRDFNEMKANTSVVSDEEKVLAPLRTPKERSLNEKIVEALTKFSDCSEKRVRNFSWQESPFFSPTKAVQTRKSGVLGGLKKDGGFLGVEAKKTTNDGPNRDMDKSNWRRARQQNAEERARDIAQNYSLRSAFREVSRIQNSGGVGKT